MATTVLPTGALPVRLSVSDILADLDLLARFHVTDDELDDDDTGANTNDDDDDDDEAIAEQRLLTLLDGFDASRLKQASGAGAEAHNDLRSEIRLIKSFLHARALLSRYSSSSSPSNTGASSQASDGGALQLDGLHARVAQMQAGIEQRERNWAHAMDALGPAAQPVHGLLADFDKLGRAVDPTALASYRQAGSSTGQPLQRNSGDGALQDAGDTNGNISRDTERARRPAWEEDWESETLAPLPLPKELAWGSASESIISTDLASPSESSSAAVSLYSALSPAPEDDDDEADDAWALGDASAQPAQPAQAAQRSVSSLAPAPHEDEDEDDPWAAEVAVPALPVSAAPGSQPITTAPHKERQAAQIPAPSIAPPKHDQDEAVDEDDAWAF